MTVIWYDTVDSTNAEVWRRTGELDNLTVVAARCQTAGRGQRGNTWTSAPGENLTFSVLLKWPSDWTAHEVIRVNWMAPVAVRDYLQEEGIDAVIKWPNDIYVGKKKICGILVENRLSERMSVIGIGLNLNQTDFPADLPNPTSFKRLTGRSLDPSAALDHFLPHFTSLLPVLQPVMSTELDAQKDLPQDPVFKKAVSGIQKNDKLNLIYGMKRDMIMINM